MHEERIHCNYPATPVAKAIILLILGLEEDLKEADVVIDAMLEKATAVDGITGEKGLSSYGAFPIQILAYLLGEMSKADPIVSSSCSNAIRNSAKLPVPH